MPSRRVAERCGLAQRHVKGRVDECAVRTCSGTLGGAVRVTDVDVTVEEGDDAREAGVASRAARLHGGGPAGPAVLAWERSARRPRNATRAGRRVGRCSWPQPASTRPGGSPHSVTEHRRRRAGTEERRLLGDADEHEVAVELVRGRRVTGDERRLHVDDRAVVVRGPDDAPGALAERLRALGHAGRPWRPRVERPAGSRRWGSR